MSIGYQTYRGEDVTAFPIRNSKALEFLVKVNGPIELTEGDELCCFEAWVECRMDDGCVDDLGSAANHRVTSMAYQIGKTDIKSISDDEAASVFNEFCSIGRNRERLLQLCKRANGE